MAQVSAVEVILGVLVSLAGVVVSLVVSFVATAGAGFLVLWFAERTFEVGKETERRREEGRRERERRREEERRRVERALRYLRLVRGEVRLLNDDLPGWIKEVGRREWGAALTIMTPVWNVVQLADLVSLVDPDVVKATASFYEQVGYANETVKVLLQSWLVPEAGVPDIGGKMRAIRDAVAKSLKGARRESGELVGSLGEEIVVLEGRLEDLEGA